MVLERARAGPIVIVQGGERKRRSIRKTIDGIAWKLMSSRHKPG